MKHASVRLATARAVRVLPVPGGPLFDFCIFRRKQQISQGNNVKEKRKKC